MDIDQLEGTFYEYMHQLGQIGMESNGDVLSFYIPMFTSCHRVLDIGCGEGQFIQLLQDEGVEVVGIDSDARMVEVCRRKGLEVVQADLFDYLPQHEEQFDGIFCSNLIEHLSAQDAIRFVKAAYRALSPGGLLLVATPNPASLIVHLYEFWRDATHVRLYSRSLLEFLLHWAGLEEIESGENLYTSWAPADAMQRVPQLLEEIGSGENLYTSRAPSDPMQRVPQSLKEIPIAKDAVARDQTREQTLEPAAEGSISPLRRMALSLRRALGRLVARLVLHEEFVALDRQFRRIDGQFGHIDGQFSHMAGQYSRIDGQLGRIDGQLGRIDGQLGRIDGQFGRIQQIEQAAYHSQDQLLTQPREVFATGIRPLPDPGD